MKRNHKYISNKVFFCFFPIFIYCCSDKKEDTGFLSVEIQTVDSRMYENELFISFCRNMEIVNSYFLLTCYKDGWETLVARESDGKEVGSIGRVGGGPGEYITPFYVGKSYDKDTIYIYDFSKRVMLLYKIDNFADTLDWHYTGKIEQQSSYFYTSVRRLNNGYYVGLRGEAEASAQLLTLFDAQMNELKTFGASPIPLERDYTDFKKCYNNTKISVYENSVFIAVNSFGYIAGYDISDKGDVAVRFEKMLIKPSYQKVGTIIFNSENKVGFNDIASSKNYLFVIYSGKTLDNLKPDGTGMEAETFAVFNHNGTLISRVALNNTAARLTVSEDEERLYFCVSAPEFGIDEYKISELLK